MRSRSAEGSLRSYVAPAMTGAVVLCLLAGVGMTLATFRLNRFDRYLDLVVLWLYLQLPLLAAGITLGLVTALGHRLLDSFRGRSSSAAARLALPIAAGSGVVTMFLLTAWARANWWYIDVHPWIQTWEQSVFVFVISLLGILAVGLISFLLVWKLLISLPAIAGPGRHRWLVMTASILVGAQLLFWVSAVAFGRRATVEADVVLPARESSAPSVILLGFDGATWRVIEPLLESGALPNLRALMERGAYGHLETLSPCNSPVLWTSIATGVRRELHGIMNFMIQHPRGMSEPVKTFPSHLGLNTAFMLRKLYGSEIVRTYPVTASQRRAATIWEIAGTLGAEVGVVNWWPSWPAGEVNGFLVSNRFDEFLKLQKDRSQHHSELKSTETGKLTSPPDLLTEIMGRVEQYEWNGLGDEEWLRLALDLYKERRPELLLVYLPGPDGAQHGGWHTYEPQYFRSVNLELIEKRGGDIPAVYRRFDKLLASVLATMTEETTIVIVSDHGSSPVFDIGFREWKAGHEHSPSGIFIAAGPGIKNTGRFEGASILDITPTILTLLGIPVAEDMEGRVLSEILTPDFVTRANWTIATWSFLVTEHESESPESGLTAAEEEALRALGYI